MDFKGDKMKHLTQILTSLAPDWVVASFPIARIVLICITTLCAIMLIVTTLLQSNTNEDGSNALSGSVGQESYYAQNKGESRNVKLSRGTIALISIMAVCIILYFVSLIIYQG